MNSDSSSKQKVLAIREALDAIVGKAQDVQKGTPSSVSVSRDARGRVSYRVAARDFEQ